MIRVLQGMGRSSTSYVEGQSGNPKGKPPGTLSLLSLIKHELERMPDKKKKQCAELLIRGYIDKAIENNDGTAIRDLIDRIDGKPTQKVIVENERVSEFVNLYRDLRNGVVQEAGGDIQGIPPGQSKDSDT